MVSDISVKGLPAECWPRRSRALARAAHCRRRPARSSHRVDELAAESAKLKKLGVSSPFVLVGLKKWLPEFAALKEVLQEEDKENNLSKARRVSRSNSRSALLSLQDLLDLANAIKANSQEGRRKTQLTLAQWQAAWNRRRGRAMLRRREVASAFGTGTRWRRPRLASSAWRRRGRIARFACAWP